MLLLSLNDVSMSFAERTLFSGVSLDVYDNDRIGFVGINGSGKTTLFRMLRGEHIPDEGAIHIAGSCKIGVMEQFACKDSDKTLYDEALTVFEWLEDMELELEELHDRIDGGDIPQRPSNGRRCLPNVSSEKADLLTRAAHSLL